MKRLALAALTLGLGACQHGPTRVTESRERPYDVIVAQAQRPIVIDEGTVVLDARRPFDFGLTRALGAVNFGWDRLAERADTGEFIRDLRRAGERLAMAGVTPRTPVVVVGDGAKGRGEEGRLAWSLLSLGVGDVRVTSNEALRKFWTQAPPVPPTNAPAWTPRRDDALELNEAGFKALAPSLAELRARRVWLVDVRSPREYLGKESIPGAVNVPWTEFYTDEGRPNPRVARKLAGVEVQKEDRVVLISPRGVRAGAAAFALMALGFPRVQVYRR